MTASADPHDDIATVLIAEEAIAARVRELGAEIGETLLHPTGCLNLGPASHASIRGAQESAERHALPDVLRDPSPPPKQSLLCTFLL